MSAMFCPDCGSENLTKLSLVYESGLSYTDSNTGGIGWGAGGLGIGGAHTSGTSVTALSDRAAPPQESGVIWATLFAFLFAGFGMIPGFYGLLILAGICGLIVLQNGRYNSTDWPRLYASWELSYMCGRCGSIAIPETSLPTAVCQADDIPALDTAVRVGAALPE